MNYELLKQFRLWDTLDKQLTKKRFSGKRRDSLYPTESSVVAVDPKTKKAYVRGGCNRKAWYRLMGFPESDPPTVKSLYIFEMGHLIEGMIAELSKLAGIYNNSSVKFWDKSSHVSGEIDLVFELPVDGEGHYIFGEAKNTWGGQIRNGEEQGKCKELFDHHEGRGKNRGLVKAKPKDQNLLQLVIYLYTHRDDEKLIGGKLIYFVRDNCNRTEFDVVLVKEGLRHRVMVNGEIDKSFFVEDVYARYSELAKKINDDYMAVKGGAKKEDLTPPDRDYDLIYPKARFDELVADGKLSKAKQEAYAEKKEPVGDWNCSYCNFKRLCHADTLRAFYGNSYNPAEEEYEEAA